MRKVDGHYPKVGSRWLVYDSIIEVKYAQHGTIQMTRGGKHDVQMSPTEFWLWVEIKGAVEERTNE